MCKHGCVQGRRRLSGYWGMHLKSITIKSSIWTVSPKGDLLQTKLGQPERRQHQKPFSDQLTYPQANLPPALAHYHTLPNRCLVFGSYCYLTSCIRVLARLSLVPETKHTAANPNRHTSLSHCHITFTHTFSLLQYCHLKSHILNSGPKM